MKLDETVKRLLITANADGDDLNQGRVATIAEDVGKVLIGHKALYGEVMAVAAILLNSIDKYDKSLASDLKEK